MTHPLVAALRSEAAEERRDACAAAAGDASAVLLVDALVDALGDADPRVARAATRALEQIGREHAAVLTALRAALRSQQPRQRLEAAWTWARLEPPPLKLLPALVSALDAAEGDARWRAARLLVELARLHAEVHPVLQNLAVRGEPRVRRIALTALRELAPDAPDTLHAHLEASRDPDAGLQRFALINLAGLRPATPELRERLRAALERAARAEPDASVRAAAKRALAGLDRRNGAIS